jgi:amino acid transporter
MNLPACLISAASTGLLLAGVRESKTATNGITTLKMILVIFMIVGGFWLWSSPNENVPWAPSGASGIFRGATSSFFGYLGYDEVCCLAGEAKNPVRDMPRAVLGTLALVTTTYILASIALTGMVDDPSDLSPTSGFPSAFSLNGVEWAAEIAAWGEVLTLPVVVLISLLAQPRLMFSMAEDGLLPEIFSRTNDNGNLQAGTLTAGIGMTIIAGCVPFTYLDDLISAGILVAFSLTDSSLVLLRRASPVDRPGLLERCLIVYNGLCFTTALAWMNHGNSKGLSEFGPALLTVATAACAIYMTYQCPPSARFGGSILQFDAVVHSNAQEYFSTPWVPFIPCLGMAVNWALIAQLEAVGLWLLAATTMGYRQLPLDCGRS